MTRRLQFSLRDLFWLVLVVASLLGGMAVRKVHFSTTATNFGLPSDFTFSNNDNGVHIFSVTLNTLGFQTVSVADTTSSSIAGSVVVDVLPKPSGGGGGGAA